MTRSSTRLFHCALFALSVGLLIMASTLLTAAPAAAKQHSPKLHKLWSQYPLNVKGPTPSVRPSKAGSQQAGATPVVTKSRAPSAGATHHRSGNGTTPSRMLLVLEAGAVLLAALFLLGNRVKPPKAPNSGRDPAVSPSDTQAASTINRAGNGYNRPVIETKSEPWTGSAPARVRLQLEDGRSLEGFTRKSNTANADLVIVDVVRMLDPTGKEAAPRPSDSFILRSEITSMQRIDDS
jgi:hypothetical protein